MSRKLICFLAFLLVGVAYTPTAHADEAIGYIIFTADSPTTGDFDVVNQTGPNSSGDSTFPVSTTVTLSGLSLSGVSETFSLDVDGLSWDGSDFPLSSLTGVDSVTLTGTLSPTTLTLFDSSTVTVNPSFSVTLSDPSGISADDFAVIYATTGSSGGGGGTVPEPESLMLVATGFAGLAGFRRRILQTLASRMSRRVLGMTVVFAGLFAMTAGAQVKLNTYTSPGSDLVGAVNVGLTGSGFPPSINPGSATLTFAASCGGTPIASTSPSAVVTLIGSTDRMLFTVPSTLTTGDYYVAVSGTNAADVSFSSTNCSEIQVTATTTTLAACVPTSSLAVVVGPNVNAFVPFGSWGGGDTGIEEVPLEGSGTAMNFATTNAVNSCAANSVTGEVVCTENGTTVDLINGATLTTVTSGSNSTAGFSGGSCYDCGVGINAANNTAVIAMGLSSPIGDSGIQFLNLTSPATFNTPIPLSKEVSEDISIDSGRNLILSPSESGYYDLLKIGSGNTITEYSHYVASYLDSAAEDCTTGIALSAIEFTDTIYIGDLTQATFTPGSPAGTWTTADQIFNLNDGNYSAGTSGISSAPGTNHLAVVTGEFGGSSYAALQLPATSGTGTPTLVDYAYVGSMPNTPDSEPFEAGYDPHTITAYTSPNSGKSYAVFSDWVFGYPTYLGVVDLQCVLGLPRAAGTHNVIGNASACTRYVAVP